MARGVPLTHGKENPDQAVEDAVSYLSAEHDLLWQRIAGVHVDGREHRLDIRANLDEEGL